MLKKALSILSILLIIFLSHAQEPNDCQFSVTVCGNSNLSIDVSGIGVQELSNSNTCSSFENNSIWLQVNIATSGTLGFILTPESNSINEDYDFFIFGPNVSCGNIGQAIRCSTTNPLSSGQGNNLTGLNATETDVSEGPGPDGNSFVSELNVLAGESYFIVIDRPIGTSPFSLEWTGTATFPENPVNPIAPELFDISICDNTLPNDDGIAEFNLTDLTNEIASSDSDVTVSYHLSESDANIDINSLGNIFENTNAFTQDIYVRLENIISGCFIIEPLSLSINSGPLFNQPPDYTICDDFIDGDNTNDSSTFNLSNVTNFMLEGFESNTNIISFHLSLVNSENNSNPLGNSIILNGPNQTEIFVRIEAEFECVYFTSFFVEILEVPQVTDITNFQCDEVGPPDGFTVFNLREFDDTVTLGIPNRLVSYHLSESEAQNNTNLINTDNYSNVSNPEVLFARVENTDTGCFNIAQVRLETSSTSANNAILNSCDSDGIDDGFTTFDLSSADPLVLNGLPPNLDLAYFETINDALLEVNPLSNSYTNTSTSNQTIYVRVEDQNNCYGIAEIELNILGLPDIETEFETVYCLNNSPEPITLTGGVINDIPNNYLYQWSTGETTTEILVNEPGTYTVRVFNANNCFKERTIQVLPSNTATIESIEVIDASDNNSIAITVSGEGEYEYALNNIEGPYRDESFFENLTPDLYTLYVRDKNGCGIVEQLVSVIGFPKFFTPNGDGTNDFWQIKGISSRGQISGPVRIFNRYGKLITEVDPLSPGWNGTYNGTLMPSSDYWFTVTLQDGREFTSHFSLKR